MSKEYGLSNGVKAEARKEAIELGVKPDSIHHICPKSLAKKYNLPVRIITSSENAIGLEQDFHDAIHKGGVFVDQETGEIIVFEPFEESDFITLSVAILGLSESDFDERNIHQSRSSGERKKKTRRKKSRRHR